VNQATKYWSTWEPPRWTGSGHQEHANLQPKSLVGHPVLQTIALATADTSALGSDFARTGLLYDQPTIVDDVFTDPYGVDWLLV